MREIQRYASFEHTIDYRYDDEHRLSGISIPGSSVGSSMSYDRDGLLVRSGSARYARGSIGELLSIRLDNSEVRYQYDSQYGELKSIEFLQSGRKLFQQEYLRDRLGRVAWQKEGGKATYFFYDQNGRLIGKRPEVSRLASHEYRYDNNGNRIYTRTPDGEASATYRRNDTLLNWDGLAVLVNYNNEGARVFKFSGETGVTTYAYDDLEHMREVTLPTSDIINYEMDALGRRTIRKFNGTITAWYLYVDNLRIAAEIDPSTNEIKKYFVYGDSPNVPDYMVFNGSRYIFVKDPRGSVRMVVNSQTGQIEQRIEYDDWGKIITDTNPGFQPFGFAGGLYDPDTKFVRFGARDYDPATGAWISKDPILFQGGDTNLYGYVLQDPVNFTDSDGLQRDGGTRGSTYQMLIEQILLDQINRESRRREQQNHCASDPNQSPIVPLLPPPFSPDPPPSRRCEGPTCVPFGLGE